MIIARFDGSTAVARGPIPAGRPAVRSDLRRDPPSPRGIPKFVVMRTDGSPPDPSARYLVLRLDTDPFARKAAQTYADAVAREHPSLADSIRQACASRLRPGWRLPTAPRCGCGGSARPIAFEDFGRWSLEWECGECCEPVAGFAIAWPFVEHFAEGADFERVGITWDYA